MLVHAKQVAGEDRRLVAAGTGADFEKHVAGIVWIAGQQLAVDFLLETFAIGVHARQFLLGHFAHARVVDHFLRGGLVRARLAQGAHALHHRGDLGVFARQVAELVLLADDRGVGEQAFDFLETFDQALEPGFQGGVHGR